MIMTSNPIDRTTYEHVAAMLGRGLNHENTDPFRAEQDAAERDFVQGVETKSEELLVRGWNRLVAVNNTSTYALRNLALFLLATSVNYTNLTAAEILEQAVEAASSDRT